MPLDSARTHNVSDDPLDAIDYCFEQGWTDGLPVVPPSVERVDEMLEYEGRPPTTVIASHPATGFECTIHSAAVSANKTKHTQYNVHVEMMSPDAAGCREEPFSSLIA